ncbi:MAG TPA: DUF2442 domain-containing protein [Herpetosiphonaceae bacterium]
MLTQTRRSRCAAIGQGRGNAVMRQCDPPFATNVSCDSRNLYIRLLHREIAIPLARLPRLLQMTPAQRQRWELLDHGMRVHWPECGVSIAIADLLDATHDATRICEHLAR